MKPAYPPETELPRITQSDIESHLRCGIRYRFDRESGHRVVTTRMLIGSAVAAGACADNHAKQGRGVGLPPLEIVEQSVTAYEEELATCECIDPRVETMRGKDATAQAADCYAWRVAPRIVDVLASEMPILAEIGDLEVAGTPDVITSLGVGDTKVGQPWTLDRADYSRQLSCYSLLHHAKFNTLPRRVWIDSIGRYRDGYRATRFFSVRNDQDLLAFMFVAKEVLRSIRAGVELPAPEAAWWCAPRWCPYWHRCPAISRRVSYAVE